MTEAMTNLSELAARIEAAEAAFGCRVTRDADGDFRIWKWGDTFFCVSGNQLAAALRAKEVSDHG